MNTNQRALLLSTVSMAMGNWGNTPTPPDDQSAPPAVGNDGELHLEGQTLLVHSARLKDLDGHQVLQVEGEHVRGVPLFQLAFRLSESLDPGQPKLLSGHHIPLLLGEFQDTLDLPYCGSAGSGELAISAVTGEGPWEVDGELEIACDSEAMNGKISFRLRADQ